MPRGMLVVLCLVLGIAGLALAAPTVRAQDSSPEDVLAMLDRAQAELSDMSQHVIERAGPDRLALDAKGALGSLLSVQESLQTLDPDGWDALYTQAIALYEEVAQAPPTSLTPLITALQEEVARVRESVQGWQAGGTTLALEEVGAYLGEEMPVSLVLERVPGAGVSSYEVEVEYKPSVVRPSKVVFKAGAGAYADGPHGLVVEATGLSLTSSGAPQALAVIFFWAVGSERESTPLSLVNAKVRDATGAELAFSTRDGSLRMLAGVATPTPEPGVTLQPTNTPASGEATPLPTASPSITPTAPSPASTGRGGIPGWWVAAFGGAVAVGLVAVGVRFLVAKK